MAKKEKVFEIKAKTVQAPMHSGYNRGWTVGWCRLYAMLLTLRESRRTPDPALPGVRSSVATASPLVALALKPSDFCNVRVELCGSNGDRAWIRISGTVRFVDDVEVKQRIFAVSPLVASIYEDPHNQDFETFCLDNVVAVIDELGGKPARRYEV